MTSDWSKPTPYPQKEIERLRDTYLTGFRLLRCGDIGEEDIYPPRPDWIEAVACVIAAWVAENYEDAPCFEGEYGGNTDAWDVVNEVVCEDFEEIDPDFKLCPALMGATLALLAHTPSYQMGDDRRMADDAFADWAIG